MDEILLITVPNGHARALSLRISPHIFPQTQDKKLLLSRADLSPITGATPIISGRASACSPRYSVIWLSTFYTCRAWFFSLSAPPATILA
ncbi:hypothetical protein OSZ53_02345 [Edwardsiella ictaluri]|nr:hypothetical protein [Edwardsiella ictaluri]